MIRSALCAAALAGAALAGSWIATPAAHAQPASALGKPLPDATMPANTVTVRVVAGSPGSPVVGADVSLDVAGTPRVVRTDASGRATFAGLPPGATVQAKILDAEQREVTSESFVVPASGGARVMLSTKPFAGGAGMPGGAAGMPEARQMSGQPRQDRGVPAGSYEVRLTYNSLEIKGGAATDPSPPVGESVTLVSYASDDSIEVATSPVNPEGRAVFDKLDVSGNRVYFALARLPRAGGADRLMAAPIQPDGEVGFKAILSGDKRDSTAPSIDELSRQQATTVPAGKVRVTLDGYPQEASPIKLIDARTKQPLGAGVPTQAPPDSSNVQGQARFEPATDLPKGTLAVKVHGGPVGDDGALADVPLRVIPADADQQAEGIASKTGSDGSVQLTVPADRPYKVVVAINGKEMVSSPFELSTTGGRLDVTAVWEAQGRPQAVFDVAYRPDLVLYAETVTANGKRYRSLPFQLVETAGAQVGIQIYPRVLVRFSLRSFVEDELLAVRGQFVVDNNSWAPYQGSPDGTIIPLPKGFKGGVVADENQADVAVAPGEGFRIVRPIPPGGKMFVGGFSMEGDGGTVRWALDLPDGAFSSGMEIRQTPGLEVRLPPNVRGESVTARDGQRWFVIDNINIMPKQSMVMTITGLPAKPGWKIWAPRIVGLFVIGILLAGVALVVFRRRAPAEQDASGRRAALLDELVELERTGKDPHRQKQVRSELESLWRE